MREICIQTISFERNSRYTVRIILKMLDELDANN